MLHGSRNYKWYFSTIKTWRVGMKFWETFFFCIMYICENLYKKWNFVIQFYKHITIYSYLNNFYNKIYYVPKVDYIY